MPPNRLLDLRLPSRHAVLFLLAIVVPCVLLVALTLRMMAQDRELVERRATDDRRRLAREVRQELIERLERIKIRALATPHGSQELTALVAIVDDGRLILPWDRNPKAALAASAFAAPRVAEALRAAYGFEGAGQFDRATGAYQRALGVARLPAQKALIELGLARVLARSGRHAEADVRYRTILQAPADLVDDQAVPFAFYAAHRLLDSRRDDESDRRATLGVMRSALAVDPPLPPAALYMLSGLANDLSRGDLETTSDIRATVSARLTDVEKALALQRSFATLFPREVAPSGATDPFWVSFEHDKDLWLVTVASASALNVPAVIAVPAATVISLLEKDFSGERINTHVLQSEAAPLGEPLGGAFPGLSLSFPANGATAAAAARGRLQRSFYVTALLLVLGVALSGGYLFWRDVRRELRMADMRSQFVSSVSHELKTPLTAIRMFAETLLLGRSTRPEVRDEYLETIVNESERLTRLLNNVLDFSQIERGEKAYRLELQSLPSVVRAATKAMQYPLGQQGFDLRVAIGDDLPDVRVDSDAIQQAILNLLSNALKYSGPGRVIELELKREGSQAVIRVTDRGPGIPLGEQARIFEKFYRVSTADNQRTSGTGLGLTLVEHIARAHGGGVTVRSAPGEGSTFSLTLPLPDAGARDVSPVKALA